MVAAFCLRLAWGLLASLVVLPAAVVPPRFYRVQFLTALFLLAVATFFLNEAAEWQLWLALAVGMLTCLAGSIVWHLRDAPWGKTLVGFALLALTVVLSLAVQTLHPAAGVAVWLDYF